MTTIETDVVVVGGGGAGLAAASAAAGLGRDVVLLEKEADLGGSTAWSVGSISVNGSRQQRARNIIDDADAHFEDLDKLAGSLRNRDNLALRRILVDNITQTFRWLESIGLVFAGPNPEPPHRLPRMHNVLPNSRAFPALLGRHCRRQGVQIHLATEAQALIRDGERVVAVEAQHHGGDAVTYRARGGVVLAGGDFSANRELKAELAGPDMADLEAVNKAASGAAIRMAREIGAEVVNGDIIRGPILRFIPPMRESLLRRLPPSRALALTLRFAMNHLPDSVQRPFAMSFLTTALGPARELFEAGAILVNRQGRRFCDETGQPGRDVPRQPGGVAYIVLDKNIAGRFTAWPYFISTAPGIAYAYVDDYRRNRRDIYHAGADIPALAKAMGVPAGALAQSILATAGEERNGRPALTSGPYVALGPVKTYVVFTDGGLRVTVRLEVIGADGEPIPGLYAAGSTGQGGVLLEGHGHHLGWAFVSGRIAGETAALQVAAGRVQSD